MGIIRTSARGKTRISLAPPIRFFFHPLFNFGILKRIVEYKIKPMTLGELLDTSIKVFLNNFLLFTMIAGVWILGFIPIAAFGIGWAFLGPGEMDPAAMQVMATSPIFLVGIFLGIGLILFLQYLSTAALTHAISEKYLGRKATWLESYKSALSRFFPLLGTLFLSSIVLFAGYLLFIIPGILLTLAFSIVAPIVLLEKRSGIDALQRARQLMKGNKGKAFLVFLIVGIAQQMAGTLGAIPIPVVNVVCQLGVSIVFFAFGQVAVTLLYFHTRCQKEAFDVELLAKSVHPV